MPKAKPLKLCECGCGGVAPIAKRTFAKNGVKKGEQFRFIVGHSMRTRSGANTPNWKGGELKIRCPQCGKDFYKKPSRIKDAKNNFCSNECHGLWKSINQNGKNNPNWQCGEALIKCDQCGKQFKKNLNKIKKEKHNFCSNDCHHLWKAIHWRGENSPGWCGWISDKGYCEIWQDKKFKAYIFERDEHKCQNPQCLGGGSQLHRHHIDYDKKNCNPNNIITICNSCNSRANSEREWHTAYYQAIMSKKMELGAMHYG